MAGVITTPPNITPLNSNINNVITNSKSDIFFLLLNNNVVGDHMNRKKINDVLVNSTMQSVNLIFPHQLFEHHPLLDIQNQFYLVEEDLFFKQFKFHQQKIAFHRASMKFYADYLIQKGHRVTYINATEQEADVRILIKTLSNQNIKQLHVIDPVDDWLLSRLKASCLKYNISLQVFPSPMFLNNDEDLKSYFKPEKKKYFLADFYKQQRIAKKILIERLDQPVGGKWSFDEENRKRYPKNKAVPKIDFPKDNSYTKEAKEYTLKNFADHLGSISISFNYPANFEESKTWLHDFLQIRFNEFGDYEDAIVNNEMVLNHSLLTPMLNTGLLTPHYVIKTTLSFAAKNNTPINSAEGFIRQIIGWREFIRGVYVSRGRQQRTRNFWGFNKKLPNSFYNGTTGILPFDETIKKILKTGYCHHIERLMILGNFMILCEIEPDEVYKWFMEFFIDAYDWVMVPNVYGMSQFADGGLMATKPYISGSNYIMKMSNYPKGEWQEIWDALFWRFLDKQRTFFSKNPRLSMLIKTYDQWPKEKKENLCIIAETFLEKLCD